MSCVVDEIRTLKEPLQNIQSFFKQKELILISICMTIVFKNKTIFIFSVMLITLYITIYVQPYMCWSEQ